MRDGSKDVRKLPVWWTDLVASCPLLPTVVSVGGLVALMFLLAPTTGAVGGPPERGAFVETFAVFSPQPVIDVLLWLRSVYHALVPVEIRQWTVALLFNPVLYLVIPFLLLLEFLFPNDSSQPIIGRSFLNDAFWFAIGGPMRILVIGALMAFLRGVYDEHLSYLTVESATAWPFWLQAATALFVSELLQWLHHFARHKIQPLWLFHAVHHSQRQLNAFTDDRTHVADRIFVSLVTFVPFFMFQVSDLQAAAVLGLYIGMHSRFVHVNAKIDLGPLGYIFASPQFHRLHHSYEEAHLDKNFGGFFSVFDHLFGTAWHERDVYPATGIHDAHFPHEDRIPAWRVPVHWVVQTVYPFRQLFDQLAQFARTIVARGNHHRGAAEPHRSHPAGQHTSRR